jgi:hypothetical protein
MSEKILQVNFKYSMPSEDYRQAVAPAADPIAAVDGLCWKVWIENEAESEAGGIYLFSDAASAQAFLEGPIVAAVVSNPAFSDFSVKQFDVMDELSAVTRGPVQEAVPG